MAAQQEAEIQLGSGARRASSQLPTGGRGVTDTRRRDGDPRAVTSPGEAPGGRLTGRRRAGRAAAASPVARQLGLLAGYLVAGIAVTWPRATWLAEGRLPATRD